MVNYVELEQEFEQFRSLRRDFHAHPELGFEEIRTASMVAERLREENIEVFTGLGGTGVVGRLSRGGGKHSIGLRADLDALPMDESNLFDHRSRAAGKFHGCGHDGHTVMLLAAARHIARHTNFNGTVYFIFQPAEEGLGGARAMIADGCLERFPMESVYAMHNAPSIPAGDFALKPGPMLAALDKFDIRITGSGCHGALPHQGVDPVVIAAQLIQALQGIVSRSVNPARSCVVSVTRIRAGDAYNVIPEKASLGGAIRYFEPETGELIRKRLAELVTQIPAASGARGEIEFAEIGYPPLVNNADCAEVALRVARSLVAADRVVQNIDPILGSDDFACFLQHVPGCYVLIGNGVGSKGGCVVHHPEYDFNDDIITTGASFWVRLVESQLV